MYLISVSCVFLTFHIGPSMFRPGTAPRSSMAWSKRPGRWSRRSRRWCWAAGRRNGWFLWGGYVNETIDTPYQPYKLYNTPYQPYKNHWFYHNPQINVKIWGLNSWIWFMMVLMVEWWFSFDDEKMLFFLWRTVDDDFSDFFLNHKRAAQQKRLVDNVYSLSIHVI